MELHERFKYPELKDAIFGYDPEYGDKYDLAIYLRRIIILSAALVRAYYKAKKSQEENMTSRTLDRIVNRPFISIDNSISILSAVQSAGGDDIAELGLSALQILSDESQADYINLYEVKSILQDETGKFFDTVRCKEVLNKVVNCLSFITETEIKNDGNGIRLAFGGEDFDVSDIFKYEFCYLYRYLQEADPIKTDYIPL